MEKRRPPRGFTLLELMVVVAIVGILAAVAIPSFMRFVLRARQAELPANLQAIRTSQIGYFGAVNTYMPAGPSPGACTNGVALPGDQKCAWNVWDADGNDLDMQTGFSAVSWIPEGPTYGQYAVVAGCPSANGHTNCFTAEARCDLDGDAVYGIWEYARPDRTGLFAGAVNFGGNVPPQDETGAAVVETVYKDATSAAF